MSSSNPAMTQVAGQQGLANLFGAAQQGGLMTPAISQTLLGLNNPNLIQGAQGVTIDDIQTNSPVTLLSIGIDRSASVHGNEDDIRGGYNDMLDEMLASKQADDILVSPWTFGAGVTCLHAHMPLRAAQRLDSKNYQATDCNTDLFDCYAQMYGAAFGYFQQLVQDGIAGQLITCIITDGGDNPTRAASKVTAAMCKALNNVPPNMKERFVPAFIGVGDEKYFRQVAGEMGFDPSQILVEDSRQPGAWRRILRQVSKSTIKTSAAKVQPGATTISNSFFI